MRTWWLLGALSLRLWNSGVLSRAEQLTIRTLKRALDTRLADTLIVPALGRLEKEGCEFENSPGYVIRSKPTWTTGQHTVSYQTKLGHLEQTATL